MTKLVKFRSLNDQNVGSQESIARIYHIIESGEFWHANRKSQNDIFEISPIIKTDFVFEEFSTYLSYLSYTKDFDRNTAAILRSRFLQGTLDESIISEFAKSMINIRDELNSEFDEYSICSFSEAKEISNPLLWGLYANSGNGVAFEIEVCDEREYEDHDLLKVKYSNERPIIPLREYIEAKFVPETKTKIFNKIFRTKSNVWHNENEIRHCVRNKQENFKVGNLQKIILGPRCDVTDTKIKSLIKFINANASNIGIYYARASDYDYKIHEIQYNPKKGSGLI